MKAWLKKYWWTLILGVVTVCSVLIAIIAWRKKAPNAGISFTTKAREKIVEAETEAQIERLKVKAKAEEDRQKLKKIEEEKDDFERRRKLADYLDGNL